MAERYYGCLTCEGELHIRMFSQVHSCLFLYIAQIDICASCYTHKDPFALEIEDHKMDHPLVKWTLHSQSGQRQWTEYEAKAVLEDLRTDVRGRDRARDIDEEDGYNYYYDHDYEEGGNEEEGRAIAAGAAVAADETMDNLNQDTETETGNQARSKGGSVDGRKKLQVRDPVALPRSYTCGRCFGSIDLDSTFYRCVGHSCRGALTH